MLTRSIDNDLDGPTIEERILLGAKRLCIIFAGGAVTLSTLDLMNIRSVESANQFIIDHRINAGDVPDLIRAGIDRFSLSSPAQSVTVQIPRDRIPAMPAVAARGAAPSAVAPVEVAARPAVIAPSTSVAVKRRPVSPVAELASLGDEDAIEMAMVSPAVFSRPFPAFAQQTAPEPQAKVTLASIGGESLSMPSAAESRPLSLPMAEPIPLHKVPLPREAPGVPPPSPAQRLHLEGKEYARAEKCLANAIYFEARSEPIRGQMAVAQVVLNRVFSPFYPDDVCSVVYQNAHRRLSCQFTFACDGKSKAIHERGAWARAHRIARETLNGNIYLPEVAKSTHYHASYVSPYWTREMKKMVRHGIHTFYRPIAWGNGADAPVWGSAMASQHKKP